MCGGLRYVTCCDGGGGLWRWGEHKVRLMDGMMQEWMGTVDVAAVTVGMRENVGVAVRVGVRLRVRQSQWQFGRMWQWDMSVEEAEWAYG